MFVSWEEKSFFMTLSLECSAGLGLTDSLGPRCRRSGHSKACSLTEFLGSIKVHLLVCVRDCIKLECFGEHLLKTHYLNVKYDLSAYGLLW